MYPDIRAFNPFPPNSPYHDDYNKCLSSGIAYYVKIAKQHCDNVFKQAIMNQQYEIRDSMPSCSNFLNCPYYLAFSHQNSHINRDQYSDDYQWY